MDRDYYDRNEKFLRKLAKRSTEDTWNCILKELTFWENCATKDCDYLPQLSDTLIESGHHDMQDKLEDWISDRPVADRFEVAGWFLFSYWLKTKKEVSLALAQKMIMSVSLFSDCRNTLHAILFGLVGAVNRQQPLNSELRSAICQTLEEARVRSKEYRLEPGIIERIEDVI